MSQEGKWEEGGRAQITPRREAFSSCGRGSHGRLGRAGTRSGLDHRLLWLLGAKLRRPGDQWDGQAIRGAG